jgi:hypothetical protein
MSILPWVLLCADPGLRQKAGIEPRCEGRTACLFAMNRQAIDQNVIVAVSVVL